MLLISVSRHTISPFTPKLKHAVYACVSHCQAIQSTFELLFVCRYLATGESYRSLAFQFRIGVTTVSRIVAEVCEVLWIHLSPDYLAAPSTSYDWLLVAENFEKKWQFPHCLGSLDGKHVVMKAPGNSGSLYFNYKGTFSLVLMALVDANLRFLAVDIGAYGRNSDGGVLSRSSMGRAFSKNALNFPEDSPLPGAPGLGKLPYVILADEAFPLTTYMMRPFPGKRTSLAQKCFNYRLSRGRRIVENAFGVLAARWRVFHTKIAVQPATARSIVKATLVLHNMLQAQTTPAQVTCLLEEVRGVPIQGLVSIQRTGNRGARQAVQVRELYMDYFTKYCPVPWQLNHVQRGSLGLDDQ